MGVLNSAVATAVGEAMPRILDAGLSQEQIAESTRVVLAAVAEATREVLEKFKQGYEK